MEAIEDPEQGEHRFVLRPNSSMNWSAIRWVIAALTLVYLLISVPFALLGLWMIMPFAGLELLAIVLCFYLVSLRLSRCEVIRINDNHVVIERGRRAPEECKELNRHWLGVKLAKPSHPWYPSRLLLISHGRHTEIGTFLTETEKNSLAQDLAVLIGGMAPSRKQDGNRPVSG